jgi:hypothetical protein
MNEAETFIAGSLPVEQEQARLRRDGHPDFVGDRQPGLPLEPLGPDEPSNVGSQLPAIGLGQEAIDRNTRFQNGFPSGRKLVRIQRLEPSAHGKQPTRRHPVGIIGSEPGPGGQIVY